MRGDRFENIGRMPTAENREVIRQNILTLEGTRWQYTHGVANPESVAPESYTLDAALLERKGNKEIQLDLVSGLRVQREALSQVSGVFSQVKAAFTCDLG